MVRNSAHHLLSLINDVLDISKIEAGQLQINYEPFDLPASIKKVEQTVRPLAEKKGLVLTIDVASDVGTVIGDMRRAEQVLLNLLSNAIKFTEEGRVIVSCAVSRGAVTTRVTDTGIGIQREDIDKVFKPFLQIDSGLTRKYEGTGLGLSICKKLVQLLGGDIWVESVWGKGSTFSVSLPVQRSLS
jgi:signal transduction histidine kinase